MADEKSDPTFDEFFNDLLAAHGVTTTAQAARELQVAESQVSRWRRGQGGIRLENLERIRETYGADIDYMRRLAHLPARGSASIAEGDPALEAERQKYRAWYQHLLDSKVPPRMWEAYTKACEALADIFSEAPSSRPISASGSSPNAHAPKNDRGSGTPPGGPLAADYGESGPPWRLARPAVSSI